MIRAAIAFALLSAAAAFAQQAAQTQFEVASIKRSDPNDRRMMFRMTPGGGINPAWSFRIIRSAISAFSAACAASNFSSDSPAGFVLSL